MNSPAGAGHASAASLSLAVNMRRRTFPIFRFMYDRRQAIIAVGLTLAFIKLAKRFELSHLRELNIDRIKIDRSFIRDIDEPNTARMIRAIIGLGVNLGVAVTAEGIETQAGMDLLARYGCELGQGFLTGSPMTASILASNFFPHDSTATQSPVQVGRSRA